MITAMISRLMILVFGTLYPAYASYKAVRTKDVKEYVKWMMYWIVFALFTCAETFTDVFFSFWFPFYYEIKVALVFWLLSPATKGSSFLYRNFVHPALQRRESEIDEMLSHAKEKGYNTVLSIGSKGVTYATNVILQTAMRGGGGLVEHIKKSYSLTDLAPKVTPAPNTDTTDVAAEASRPTRGRRGIAGSAANLEMRFSEVDVNIRQCPTNDILSDIRSSEDISSGYSSTDQLYTEGVLTRSSSVSSTRARGRGNRSSQSRRAPLTEDSEGSDDESERTNTKSSYSVKVSLSDTLFSAPNIFASSLDKSQQNELTIKLEDNGANIEDLSQYMDVITEEPIGDFEVTTMNTVGAAEENSASQETEVNKELLQTKPVSVGSHLVGDPSADTTAGTEHADDMALSIKANMLDVNSDVIMAEEEKIMVVTGLLELKKAPSLKKCSSETSVASVSSLSSSSDIERKGKYKKLPAPRPPSREVDTVRELPELEQKLSDTEALMKKISSVNVQELSSAKETLV
ncbi:uncharacterized protein isoform X3 [Rhodnius prolixus]|uniref:uncharacterized protein isoform X3 n=1 Tax=Rhodnius prolixus TaxID=13249 RepID=UPI003D1889C8